MISPDWPVRIHDVLRRERVRQVSFVPDAGHARLIELCRADAGIRDVVLTTEEEGVALAAGAWLGGERAAVLMQSSGVGNCINMLAVTRACRFPLVLLVTMRGEHEEFNPWQVPMGATAGDALRLAGVDVRRADTPEAVEPAVAAGVRDAFASEAAVAVLIGQRVIGAKRWTK